MNSTPSFKIGIQVVNDAMNPGDKTCELYFTDSIYNRVNYWTGEEISMLQECIDEVNKIQPTKIIQYIDSWGGSAPVGFGLYNFLKNHKAKVETKILNNCASIASVMAMAGNKGKISMPVNGMMVIHKAMNAAQGTADELRAAADLADKYTEQVVDVYVRNNRKGKTKDEIMACMDQGDYWMTGQEALDMGFVDCVYNDESVTITNSIEAAKKIYNNIPQRILDMAKPTNSVPAATTVSIDDSVIDKIKNFFDMQIQNLKNAFTSKLPENTVVNVGGTEINFGTMLQEPINSLLEAINTEITADIANARKEADTAVAEAVANKTREFQEIVDALKATVTDLTNKLTTQETTITDQKKQIDNIVADMTRKAGGAAASMGGDPAAALTGKKTLSAGVKPYNGD